MASNPTPRLADDPRQNDTGTTTVSSSPSTMLYTAITRGIETLVLVGDIDLINEIIEAAPASLQRTTALWFDEN
ncbi:hypothetical protein ACU8NH_08305 [Rhizobium leguminosarum]